MLERLISFLRFLFGFKCEPIDDDTEPIDIEPVSSGETITTEDNFEEEEDVEPISVFVSPVKILVDNGHGNNTPGKRSPYSANGVPPEIEFFEYKWNREIAGRIVAELRKKGYDAELLVPEENDIPLSERVERVNAICKKLGTEKVILLSIHSNAAGSGHAWMDAKGWSAYTTRGKTNSDILAEYLYLEAKKKFADMRIRVDLSDGDNDWESDFYILKKTLCPAVLTENFFYDNVGDVKFILSSEGKEAIIKTHVDGIINYIGSL